MEPRYSPSELDVLIVDLSVLIDDSRLLQICRLNLANSLLLTLDLYLQKISIRFRARKRKRERKEEEEEEEEEGRKRKKKKKRKRRKKKNRMATTSMVSGGAEARCPHHPRGSGFVCLDAHFHEEMKRRLIASGNILESLFRAMDGDAAEQRALDHPVDLATLHYPVERSVAAGWSCTPMSVFVSSNHNLAANTLALARCQLDMEREATRNTSTRTVSEGVNSMSVRIPETQRKE